MSRVGIIGLGLIGGSFAKAYHAAGWEVLASNRTRSTLDFAVLAGDVNGELTKENAGSCDLVLVTIYPEAAIRAIRDFAPHFGEKPIVMDCCGTKRVVCEACFPIAEEYGFTYVGGHPMAGTQYSGYRYARANLYHNAPMVIVPPNYDDIFLLNRIKELLLPAGFGKISVTTAEKHDEMIAFTSQLAHVVSNAYVKSPTSRIHHGFSAGSYKDLTRVAWLNAPMWAELFLENKDYLLAEVSGIIEHLDAYRRAMEADDKQMLTELLEEGKRIVSERTGARRCVLVSGENVFPLYGEAALHSLRGAGLEAEALVFPAGENTKSLACYGELMNRLTEAKLSRSDCLVALGGGVTGDLTGFAAATYQRGIACVQVPTTLLAAVDSSVGGKTAINLPAAKNQVGAFYQPSLVLCDTDTLDGSL